MQKSRRILLLVSALLPAASCATGAAGPGSTTPPPAPISKPAPPPTPPPVVVSSAPAVNFTYDATQATRGEAVFKKSCNSCHELTEHSGPDFRLKWNGRAIFDLFDLLQTTMPDDNPGGLPKSDYADVTAYIMKLNGVRAGPMVYSTDPGELKKIKIDIPR